MDLSTGGPTGRQALTPTTVAGRIRSVIREGYRVTGTSKRARRGRVTEVVAMPAAAPGPGRKRSQIDGPNKNPCFAEVTTQAKWRECAVAVKQLRTAVFRW